MGKQRNKMTKSDRLSIFLEEKAITINTFFKKVLGLRDNNIMKESLSHADLVKIFPDLRRTSYDLIMDDPSMVSTGEIIIVIDANANIIPYENPVFKLLKENSTTIDAFIYMYLDEEISVDSHRELVEQYPHLQKVGYEYIINNPNLIYEKKIIVVRDKVGNICPYVNPLIKHFTNSEGSNELTSDEVIIVIDENGEASIISFKNPVFKLLNDNCISIDTFINVYLEDENRVSSHKELVEQYHGLKRVNYEFAFNNSNLILEKKLIVVRDDDGNLCTYINPMLKNFIDSEEFEQVMDNNTWTEDTEEWTYDDGTNPVQSYDLKTMTNYQLETLMELYSKTGQWHSYEIVRKELVSRPDCKRANKVSKRNALIKAQKRIKQDDY